MKTHINQLENKIKILECRQIANDIIINGVPEHKAENRTQLIQQNDKELNLKINESIKSFKVEILNFHMSLSDQQASNIKI